MFYVIFIVAVTLACVAGVEFCYVMFLERMVGQHKRRIVELERENLRLKRALSEREEGLEEEVKAETELWPEVVDEDDRPVG